MNLSQNIASDLEAGNWTILLSELRWQQKQKRGCVGSSGPLTFGFTESKKYTRTKGVAFFRGQGFFFFFAIYDKYR